MKLNNFLERLSQIPNGSFFKISWVRELPLYKEHQNSGIIVLKEVNTVARKGIKPWNTKLGRTKDPSTHKLPWGMWKKGYEGTILEHKDKHYVRLFLTNHKPLITYYLNGQPIDKETLLNMHIVTKAGWTELDPTTQDFFCVSVDNIIKIG